MRSSTNLQQIAQSIMNAVNTSPWVLMPVMFICAMALMLIIGSPMIDWLRGKRWRKGEAIDETWTVREDTPDTHQAKQGTPSMGGIGMISAAIATHIAVISTVWGIEYLARPSSFLPLPWDALLLFSLLPVTTGVYAALGFADDWSKASGRGGLRARSKFLLQLLLAAIFLAVSVYAVIYFGRQGWPGDLPKALAYIQPLTVLILVGIIVSTCNAVNLADGIDGLAVGLTVQTCIALLLCGTSLGIKVASDLFCAALAGACLGFLWFNRHPARVFMGDTGSLAIGATLGAAAILSRAALLLPFIGFIFYVEMLSVIIQVLWFKWTRWRTGEGKRIFRRAPLHHHFELSGWSEWRVVLVFWAVNLCTSLLGLILWHRGVLPRWP